MVANLEVCYLAHFDFKSTGEPQRELAYRDKIRLSQDPGCGVMPPNLNVQDSCDGGCYGNGVRKRTGFSASGSLEIAVGLQSRLSPSGLGSI